MLRRIAAASACVLFTVPALRAQNLTDICQRVMRPPVGAWSRFRVEGGRENGATVRMAVVGTEEHGDTTYLWLEMEMHGVPMGGSRGEAAGAGDTVTVISKTLVRGFGPGMAGPREVVIKWGTMPAMAMPMNGPRVGGPAPGSEALRNCERGRIVGWESVTVPAGTFRALHVQDENGGGDMWIQPDLPFALIKTEKESGANAQNLVLVAHGTGARTAITETPQPFNPQAFMQMMMQQRQPH
jgi:hypothetical protein